MIVIRPSTKSHGAKRAITLLPCISLVRFPGFSKASKPRPPLFHFPGFPVPIETGKKSVLFKEVHILLHLKVTYLVLGSASSQNFSNMVTHITAANVA